MFWKPQNLQQCLRRLYSSSSCLAPTIKQILNNGQIPAKTVVHGWVKSIRRQKKATFIAVNDGSTLEGMQAVFLHPNGNVSDTISNVSTGTSVRLIGELIQSPGRGQEKELRVEEVVIFGLCDPLRYPIQKKDHSLEFLREHMHLRPRTSAIAAMLRVRGKLTQYFNDWYQNDGFIYVHPPVLTSNDCEGAGEAYQVMTQAKGIREEFPLFLTTSTQLHLEALTSSFTRVFTIAPSFRAERSQTNRHLNEFWMLEAEINFLEKGLSDVCNVLEASLKTVLGKLIMDEDVRYLREQGHLTEKQFQYWLNHSIPWTRVSYTQAIERLQEHHLSGRQPYFEFESPKWGQAFRSEHERWIAATMGANAQPGPVFVTDYPRNLKPFYMSVNEDIPEGATVACFDLLVPKLGELVGGSMRESREEKLSESLRLFGMSEPPLYIGNQFVVP
ncbi:hypothetical protein Clacol_009149 [Clathrus columnatus]|uniref:asparagine--tRNA ligase n=1 Tax=Clathrus columnatus TaxID=1419009 RepID=A0AAV5AKF1_9AGAM|nr:hypothetical protein Clacol_009149 [Clathrus columnatus]